MQATIAGQTGRVQPRSLPEHARGLEVSDAVKALPVLHGVVAIHNSVTTPEEAGLTAEQEQLLLEALPVVRYVARTIHDRLPQHVELDELIGAGTLGLVDAARKFNPEKNVQFRSYAQFRIRGAILDSLRSLDWSPRELRRKARAMDDCSRLLQLRLGRAPQEAEVAVEMGLSLLQLQQLRGQLKGLEVASLHVERSEDSSDDELMAVPARESENPLFQYLEGESRQRLTAALDSLPERDRLVMTLYYFEEMTMREIGLLLGVVESRVSQIHHLALKRLRGLLLEVRSPGRGIAKPVAQSVARGRTARFAAGVTGRGQNELRRRAS